MIALKIAGEKFEAPYRLDEIPLYRYIEYLEWREENLPKVLQDLESIEGETEDEILTKRHDRYEAMTSKEEQDLLNFYCEEVAFWLDAETKLIRRCDISDVIHVWQLIQNSLIPKEQTDYSCFELKGDIYYLPERMMQNSTFEDYAESCQYEEQLSKLAKGEYKVLPYIAAIISRRKDENGKLEGYDDYDVKSRSALFNAHLTANDAMQIGFFLRRLSEKSQQSFQIFMTAQSLSKLKQATKN
jgi:hypothetical protein